MILGFHGEMEGVWLDYPNEDIRLREQCKFWPVNGKMCVVVGHGCCETDSVNISDLGTIRDDGVGCKWCPLNRVKTGVAVRIKQLCARPEIQNRLREIGLGEEQVIRLLTSHANFICLVCNARLAISEQLARVILVEPVSPVVKV